MSARKLDDDAARTGAIRALRMGKKDRQRSFTAPPLASLDDILEEFESAACRRDQVRAAPPHCADKATSYDYDVRAVSCVDKLSREQAAANAKAFDLLRKTVLSTLRVLVTGGDSSNALAWVDQAFCDTSFARPSVGSRRDDATSARPPTFGNAVSAMRTQSTPCGARLLANCGLVSVALLLRDCCESALERLLLLAHILFVAGGGAQSAAPWTAPNRRAVLNVDLTSLAHACQWLGGIDDAPHGDDDATKPPPGRLPLRYAWDEQMIAECWAAQCATDKGVQRDALLRALLYIDEIARAAPLSAVVDSTLRLVLLNTRYPTIWCALRDKCVRQARAAAAGRPWTFAGWWDIRRVLGAPPLLALVDAGLGGAALANRSGCSALDQVVATVLTITKVGVESAHLQSSVLTAPRGAFDASVWRVLTADGGRRVPLVCAAIWRRVALSTHPFPCVVVRSGHFTIEEDDDEEGASRADGKRESKFARTLLADLDNGSAALDEIADAPGHERHYRALLSAFDSCGALPLLERLATAHKENQVLVALNAIDGNDVVDERRFCKTFARKLRAVSRRQSERGERAERDGGERQGARQERVGDEPQGARQERDGGGRQGARHVGGEQESAVQRGQQAPPPGARQERADQRRQEQSSHRHKRSSSANEQSAGNDDRAAEPQRRKRHRATGTDAPRLAPQSAADGANATPWLVRLGFA